MRSGPGLWACVAQEDTTRTSPEWRAHGHRFPTLDSFRRFDSGALAAPARGCLDAFAFAIHQIFAPPQPARLALARYISAAASFSPDRRQISAWTAGCDALSPDILSGVACGGPREDI